MTQHLTRRESFLHTDWAMALFAHCVIGFYWKPVKPLVFHHPPHQGPPCPSLPLPPPPSLIDWSELTLAELRWAAFNDISFLTSTTGRFGSSNAAAAVQRKPEEFADRWAAMSNPYWFFLFLFFFTFISFNFLNCQHILTKSLKTKKQQNRRLKKWMVLFS